MIKRPLHNTEESELHRRSSELVQSKTGKGKSRPTMLAIMALLFLFGGGVCQFQPIRIVMANEQTSFTVGPELENSVDFIVNLDYGQSATIMVSFEDDAESGHRHVWPLIFYQYPTKLLIETVARLVNQSEASLSIGWENASYIRVFIIRFMVRVFYEGDAAVAVNISVTSFANPVALAGMGLLAVSAAPLWVAVKDSRREVLWQIVRV